MLASPGVDVLRGWVREAELAGTSTAVPATASSAPASKLGAMGQPSAAQRRVGVLYAAALASAKLRDLPGARAQANTLAPLVAGDSAAQRVLQLLLAEIALQANNPAQALQILQALPADSAVAAAGPAASPSRAGSGHAFYPTRGAGGADAAVPGAFGRTHTCRPGRGGAAAANLGQCVRAGRAGVTQLSSVQTALGQPVQAARSSAESRAAQLDYPAALDRMRAAQQLQRQNPQRGGNDYIEASIVDQRTRELQAQVTELAREKALER